MSTSSPGDGQPHGDLRDAQRRFTKQHILDAALAVFVERGYVASTVEDIIERAGTSRRTFYAHFRSKVDIFIEAGATLLPEIQEQYRALDEALAEGSREALYKRFEASIEWRAQRGALVSVWEQAAAFEPAQQADARQVIEGIPDLMARFLDRWPEEQ